LNNEFQHFQEDIVIIPTDDESALYLDKNSHLFNKKFRVPKIESSKYSIEELMNKQVMNDIARKNGFNVPISIDIDFKITKIEDIIKLTREKIGFPCIIKPILSADGDKSDIILSNNSQSLQSSIEALEKKYKKVLIQQYINKT